MTRKPDSAGIRTRSGEAEAAAVVWDPWAARTSGGNSFYALPVIFNYSTRGRMPTTQTFSPKAYRLKDLPWSQAVFRAKDKREEGRRGRETLCPLFYATMTFLWGKNKN